MTTHIRTGSHRGEYCLPIAAKIKSLSLGGIRMFLLPDTAGETSFHSWNRSFGNKHHLRTCFPPLWQSVSTVRRQCSFVFCQSNCLRSVDIGDSSLELIRASIDSRRRRFRFSPLRTSTVDHRRMTTDTVRRDCCSPLCQSSWQPWDWSSLRSPTSSANAEFDEYPDCKIWWFHRVFPVWSDGCSLDEERSSWHRESVESSDDRTVNHSNNSLTNVFSYVDDHCRCRWLECEIV